MMKTSNFRYDVRIEIEFTIAELEIIQLCMLGHYDAVVKMAAEQGGFFYGWMNYVEMSGPVLICEARQLGICAKATEQPTAGNEPESVKDARCDLHANLIQALKALGEEHERVNEVKDVQSATDSGKR